MSKLFQSSLKIHVDSLRDVSIGYTCTHGLNMKRTFWEASEHAVYLSASPSSGCVLIKMQSDRLLGGRGTSLVISKHLNRQSASSRYIRCALQPCLFLGPLPFLPLYHLFIHDIVASLLRLGTGRSSGFYSVYREILVARAARVCSLARSLHE